MNAQTALWCACAACFGLFVVLGIRVARKPLGAIDAFGASLRGRHIRTAILFTRSGRSPGVTAMCAVAIVVFALARLPLRLAAIVILSQIISQTIVELIKARYRRIRPEYWLDRLEAGHSYPSGHATTAVVFFCGWAAIAAASSLPLGAKIPLCAALVAWAAGVSWSRLALGAHYLSDVTGGILFGFAWLCALAAGLRVGIHAP